MTSRLIASANIHDLPGGSYRTEGISFVDEHLNHMRRCDMADSTIKARRMVLTWLAEYLGHDPATATHAELDRWQASLPTVAQIRWKTAMITPYYRYLQAWGHRQDNPAALLPRPKRKRRMPRPIPEDRLFAAVAAAPMPVQAFLLLAGWCGLRATEIAAMRVEDITPGLDGCPVILVHGKGGDERTVPMPGWVHEVLAPTLPETGPCFTRTYGDRSLQVTRKQVSDNVAYYLGTKCGITDRLHSLRHRVATALMHDTHDVRLVQDVLGHANLATLHVYTEVRADEVAAAVARLPRPPQHRPAQPGAGPGLAVPA